MKPFVGRYDGTLVGCAIWTFLSVKNSSIVPPSLINRGLPILLILSFVVGVVHSSCVNMNKLPALTLAFNIVILAFLLSVARGESTVATPTWLTGDSPPPPPSDENWQDFDIFYFFDALFRGIGQFCFVPTTWGGLMVLLGIFTCSRQAGSMALLGSFTALFVARFLLVLPRGHKNLIRAGLFGYNAMGTCVAMGGDVFFKSDPLNTLVAVFGAGLTVLIQTAVESILDTDGLGLPVLTIPFVATTWIIMLSRSDWLKPILAADADLDDARMLDRRHEDQWWYRPKKRIFNQSPKRRDAAKSKTSTIIDTSSPMHEQRDQMYENETAYQHESQGRASRGEQDGNEGLPLLQPIVIPDRSEEQQRRLPEELI